MRSYKRGFLVGRPAAATSVSHSPEGNSEASKVTTEQVLMGC